jgi:hypothetical protein
LQRSLAQIEDDRIPVGRHDLVGVTRHALTAEIGPRPLGGIVNRFTNFVLRVQRTQSHALGERPFGAKIVVLQVDRVESGVAVTQ